MDKSEFIDWQTSDKFEYIDSQEGQAEGDVTDNDSRESNNSQCLKSHIIPRDITDTVETPRDDKDPNEVR